MRRISFVLFVCMLVFLSSFFSLSYETFAETPLPIINSKEELLDAVKEKVKTFDTTMVFNIGSMPESDCKIDFLRVPEISSYKYKIKKAGNKSEISYTMTYTMAAKLLCALKNNKPETLNSKESEVYAAVKSVIEKNIVPSMTEYEKEKAIHDYIILNTKYDTTHDAHSTDSYNPYGVLINGTGVCQAYAETMWLFMNVLGIECDIIKGFTSEEHAWNRIKIDGEYYQLDVTWNDPVPDVAGGISYAYFNLTDKQMELDHKFDIECEKSCVATKYNYFVYNNAIAANQRDFENTVKNAFKQNKSFVEIQCMGVKVSELSFVPVIKYFRKIYYSINYKQNIVLINFQK